MRKYQATAGTGVASGLTALAMKYGTPNIPDSELQIWVEASVLPVLVAMVAYVWYRYLDKDHDGVLDFMDDDVEGFDDEENGVYDNSVDFGVEPWNRLLINPAQASMPLPLREPVYPPAPSALVNPASPATDPVQAVVQAPAPSPPVSVVAPVNPSGDGTGSSPVTAVVPPVLDPVDLQETLQRVLKLLEVLEKG